MASPKYLGSRLNPAFSFTASHQDLPEPPCMDTPDTLLGPTAYLDPDSLSCQLIVKYRASSGKCSVNKMPLLHFDDEKQEGNAAEVCTDLLQSLRDILEVMWNLQSGNHALHVTIISKYNQGEFLHGHWAISTDEQCGICFDPFDKTWRESHSGASCAMGQLKENKELEQGLRNVLVGDFSLCLKKLSPYSREMPTLPTTAAHVDQPPSMACKSNLFVELIMILLIYFLWHVF
ncbi:histocompatibility antigen 60c-like [Mus pahari]|uniref:histocompatibility antigen 60c-like n=1 Tax=Mus pahari TaxID=10093 RepID=UPI000A31197C|nr:histocompatibility antigen 60c-like [Mus pahari]